MWNPRRWQAGERRRVMPTAVHPAVGGVTALLTCITASLVGVSAAQLPHAMADLELLVTGQAIARMQDF
jgi:hypothetical protein